jgi:D-alanine-D-alanine ligase
MSSFPSLKLNNPAGFGRVGLLVGGESAEREVSLDGGVDIASSFERSGIEYQVYDGARALLADIEDEKIDRVFNLMHGPDGEDGAVQGALQLLKIPVTGTGLLGSALTMDKIRSKRLLSEQKINTAEFEVITLQHATFEHISKRFGFPVFVKPSGLGSSIGVSKVTSADDLDEAIKQARAYGDEVIVEPAIDGDEYFAGILDGVSLPLIRIETPREFYDYEAKYESDDTRYYCPCGLDGELEVELQQRSLEAFDALHGSGWGRVDFILDRNRQAWFLEINTIPGMTSDSLVPQAAAAMGLGFDDLVWRILETSL